MIHKVAIIGAGRWGRNIVKVLAGLPELSKIEAIVYSGNPDTKEFLAVNYPKIPRGTDVEKVLNDSSITHVMIATQIDTHYSLAKKCLVAGKHTFVEKPLCLEESKAKELHALALEKNLTLATGYVYLFDDSLLQLRNYTKTGTSVSLKMKWEKWGTFDSLIITNLLVHELAIAHFLMGNFEKITSSTIRENQLSLLAQYQHGTVSIAIDREKSDKKKIITAVIDEATYSLENGELKTSKAPTEPLFSSDTSRLLEYELTSFLNDKEDYDWEVIDVEVAKILDSLII